MSYCVSIEDVLPIPTLFRNRGRRRRRRRNVVEIRRKRRRVETSPI
jgi:hypothetical protein